MISSIKNWVSGMEPYIEGVKTGSLTIRFLREEEISRQGRHHMRTTIMQTVIWDIALEYMEKSLRTVSIDYSFKFLHVVKYLLPASVSYLVNCRVERFYIKEGATRAQDYLGKLGVLAIGVSAVALLVLKRQVEASTICIYSMIGLLDYYNFFPPTIQKVLYQAHFWIGNLSGLYSGRIHFRVICGINLIMRVVKNYFDHQHENQKAPLVENFSGVGHEEEKISELKEEDRSVSLEQIREMGWNTRLTVKREHIHIKIFPPIRKDVKLEDLLDLFATIDWTRHEQVLKTHLSKDSRWLELGESKNVSPVEYLRKNLLHFINCIKNEEILQGKPASYEMLKIYCSYIAQELPYYDEMMQADFLVSLGIDGGDYCGSGQFEIVEELYGDLISLSTGLPLEHRLLACLQQKRIQIWQQLYNALWKLNPGFQLLGYLQEVSAVHTINTFINSIDAGFRFGIPSEAAQNDEIAQVDPIHYYLYFPLANEMENSFWEESRIPQYYFSFRTLEDKEKWKFWKWVKLTKENILPDSYDEAGIIGHLNLIIGTPQIPKTDIFEWWRSWILRQTNLTTSQKDDLLEDLAMNACLDGEPMEIDGKIQPKFLQAMLIEMGVLENLKNS